MKILQQFVAEFNPAKQGYSCRSVNSPLMAAECKAVGCHILHGDFKLLMLLSRSSAIQRSWWDQELNLKGVSKGRCRGFAFGWYQY